MSTFSPRSVKQVHNFSQYNYSSWYPHLLMWFIYFMYFCIQMGSYFGYAVATTDINSDGWVGVCLAHRPFFRFLFYSLVLAWQKMNRISVNGRLQTLRRLSLNDRFLAAGWPICWLELLCSWSAAPTTVWKKWAGSTFTCSAAHWTWSSFHTTWLETRCTVDTGAPLHHWEIWTRMASTVRRFR